MTDPEREFDATGLEGLLDYVKEARGFDFTGYKRASLTRRITRRAQAAGMDNLNSYRELLEAEPEEFARLFDTILINVTGFLRDRDAWEYLATTIVPAIASRDAAVPIRVWSAGCASGEEAYSLAILLCDAVGEDRFRHSVKIYGTDVDQDALAHARLGRYAASDLQSVFSEQQLSQYFTPVNGDMVFRKDLRRTMIFGRHDLVQDPPISRVDLLACRNTLMYFMPETQRRILGHFRFALIDGGFLFLGKSEALVTRTGLFDVQSLRYHVFSKPSGRAVRPAITTPPVIGPGLVQPRPREFLEAVFESSPVAQVVIDGNRDVALANRHARYLLGIGVQSIGRPYQDLSICHRLPELRSAVDQVFADRRPVTLAALPIEPSPDAGDFVEVHVLPIGGDGAEAGVGVTVRQVGRYKALREELERSQRELETAYEELQSTVEELETTNEELQSTNEELETTNEEVHSTNEELETMNEELQSTNEELETINNELRERTAELDDINRFLESILGSIGFAVVVLDHKMSVRAWNRQAADMWGLWPEEASGQHFLNLDIGLPVDDLRGPVRHALAGKSPGQQLTLNAVNRRGRAIVCQVRVLPMSSDDEVVGTILLMEPQTEGSSPQGPSPA